MSEPALSPDERKARRRRQRELRKAQAFGMLEGLCAGLTADSVCVDCGAHYGTITTRLARTGARVHAFEPDPHSFAQLTAAAGDLPNVTLHNAAVSVAPGTLTLWRNHLFDSNTAEGSTGSTIIAENKDRNPDNAVTVPAIDLPAFLADLLARHGRLAFLKIDIEGAEVEILERLVQTDILPRINLTVVETHQWLFPQWQDRYDALDRIAAERPDLRLNLHWI